MENKIKKYADLLVRIGINIQKDQTLVVNSPIECAEFARTVSVCAYEAGAREVIIRWNDEKSSKVRYMMANEEVFDEFPQWTVDFYDSNAEKNAAFLTIKASDPELMKDVDPKKMARQNKSSSTAMESYRTKLMSNENVWCVTSIPTESWARKVFPDAGDKAVDLLWDAIFKSVRIDREDPVGAWREHQKDIKMNLELLNGHAFKKLRYRNSIGTDVVVELPDNHIWFGGGDKSSKGQEFIANMPTEEIFTMPKLDGVNGKIVSSIPLCYNGNLVEDFSFVFKDGIVVAYDAKKGKDVLTELLDTDEGARRLGEVALVPYDSPISNQKILFYRTLFDENASCHFALGKAYPICIKDGAKMDKETLHAAGGNHSLVHVDFMIGTSDLEIVGIKEDGSEVTVFENGNFK